MSATPSTMPADFAERAGAVDPFSMPRAAWGPFPYPGRTVAEVDSDDAHRRARLFGQSVPAMPFCAQCDRLVPVPQVALCRSQFCSLRKVA